MRRCLLALSSICLLFGLGPVLADKQPCAESKPCAGLLTSTPDGLVATSCSRNGEDKLCRDACFAIYDRGTYELLELYDQSGGVADSRVLEKVDDEEQASTGGE